MTDSSALTSFFQAGGTVRYNLFSGGTCSGTATVVSNVTVTNGVILNSAAQTFSSVGTFSWNAIYSGDANNFGATSACEPLTVNPPSAVGGVVVPINRLALLAPYVALASMIVTGTVATIYVTTRVRSRKDKGEHHSNQS